MKGQKTLTLTFSMTQVGPSKKKDKNDNREKLDCSCSIVQAEQRANTLNTESISKSGNLAKSSIVIALSSKTSSAD